VKIRLARGKGTQNLSREGREVIEGGREKNFPFAAFAFFARNPDSKNFPEKELVRREFAGILCGSLTKEKFMARICELTGKRPMKGSIIWRSGKPKKSGGIGTHITAITKRKFLVNIQRVKALLPSGEVRYVRVSAAALKKGLVTKAPKRTWKKGDEAKKA
jgi:large subunit ribosomal protein L28